jgi:hypothetical protein
LAADRVLAVDLSRGATADNDNTANRSYLVDPDGAVVARYDKITCSTSICGGEATAKATRSGPGGQTVLAERRGASLG